MTRDEMRAFEKKAAEAGHGVRVREIGYMCDKAFCACGWESHGYFDGAEFAWDDWKRHIDHGNLLHARDVKP